MGTSPRDPLNTPNWHELPGRTEIDPFINNPARSPVRIETAVPGGTVTRHNGIPGITSQSSAARVEQRRAEASLRELFPVSVSYQVATPFSASIVSWIPDQDYLITGYDIDMSCSVFSSTNDMGFAIAWTPTWIPVGTQILTLKSTIVRATQKCLPFEFHREKEYGEGFIYVRQDDPLYFLATCDMPAPNTIRGNFILNCLPVEVRN